MNDLPAHLIFYDGTCGLCDRLVVFLLKVDTDHQFIFAPLRGVTAEKFLADIPPEMKGSDSLFLIENYLLTSKKIFQKSQAVFSILWILGFPWRVAGWLRFFPSFIFDSGYSFIARNRRCFFLSPACSIPLEKDKERFLP